MHLRLIRADKSTKTSFWKVKIMKTNDEIGQN